MPLGVFKRIRDVLSVYWAKSADTDSEVPSLVDTVLFGRRPSIDIYNDSPPPPTGVESRSSSFTSPKRCEAKGAAKQVEPKPKLQRGYTLPSRYQRAGKDMRKQIAAKSQQNCNDSPHAMHDERRASASAHGKQPIGIGCNSPKAVSLRSDDSIGTYEEGNQSEERPSSRFSMSDIGSDIFLDLWDYGSADRNTSVPHKQSCSIP